MATVIALRSFFNSKHGDIDDGQTLTDVDPSIAARWVSLGMVRILNPGEVMEVPKPLPLDLPVSPPQSEPEPEPEPEQETADPGADSEPSLSPAARASTSKTRKRSKAAQE